MGKMSFLEIYRRAPVTISIIFLNVLLYLISVFSSGGDLINGPDTWGLLTFGAQYGPLISSGQYYRLITPIFLHGGIFHIFFNTYAFFYFGVLVESFFSSSKFLYFYLISGLAGNVLTHLFMPQSISVGASGAIFGLVGLLFAMGLKKDIPPQFKKFTGKTLLPMILINLVIGFTVPAVNNFAHMGGLITGFALGFLFKPGIISIGATSNTRFFRNKFILWKFVEYLFIGIIVLSILLNFIFLVPPVDGIVNFNNSFAQVLQQFSGNPDWSENRYYLNLIAPYDRTTRSLKKSAESYFDSGGSYPNLLELNADFKIWQDEVLIKFPMFIRKSD